LRRVLSSIKAARAATINTTAAIIAYVVVEVNSEVCVFVGCDDALAVGEVGCIVTEPAGVGVADELNGEDSTSTLKFSISSDICAVLSAGTAVNRTAFPGESELAK
jgi:hypothetical protein